MTNQPICVPLPPTDLTGGRTIITSSYGQRGARFHYGTDLGTTDGIEIGTPEHAVYNGVIDLVGNALPNAAGLFVWLRTDLQERNVNGRLCQVGYKYFHMKRYTVMKGDKVKIGQKIGEAGMSGTTAAHLHLQKHLLNDSTGEWSDATAVNNTPELQQAINLGRWPGIWNAEVPTIPPVSNSLPVQNPIHGALDMSIPVSFPYDTEGNRAVYVIVYDTNIRDWGWKWVSPQDTVDLGANYLDLYDFGATVPLAAGHDDWDALWNRYPIIDGPAVGDH